METIVKTLEQKGWFPLVEEISFHTQKQFEKYVIKQTGDLKILFRCGGGDLQNSLEIIDIMEFYKNATGKKIHGFVLSQCSSAALNILSVCNGQREASKGSRFLFHSSFGRIRHTYLDGREANQKIFEAKWEDLENLSKTCQEIMASGFNLSIEKIIELKTRGEVANVPINAETALALGIIHNITPLPSNF